MTPTDVQATVNTIKALWPKCVTRTPEQWSVFIEKCSGIESEHAQAVAALRQLLASSDKYPTVHMLLTAIKNTEQRAPDAPRRSPTGQSYTPPHIERDQDGLTSFERRVIDDPDFRTFARKVGCLPKARERLLVGDESHPPQGLGEK